MNCNPPLVFVNDQKVRLLEDAVYGTGNDMDELQEGELAVITKADYDIDHCTCDDCYDLQEREDRCNSAHCKRLVEFKMLEGEEKGRKFACFDDELEPLTVSSAEKKDIKNLLDDL